MRTPDESRGDAIPEYAHVHISHDGYRATLTVRNAKSMNILDSRVVKQLTQAFEYVKAQAGVRVIVLRGSGEKSFLGGAHLGEMSQFGPGEAADFISSLADLAWAIRAAPQPVIARIAGWTLGGGLEVAAACDIRIAASGAQFGMPEVAVGIPSVVQAALLPRLIGAGRSRWLMLSGEAIDARTASEWGLVTEVVPSDALERRVTEVVELLAGHDPAVLADQKRLLNDWDDQLVTVAVQESIPVFRAAFERGTPQRIMAEFMDRKKRL